MLNPLNFISKFIKSSNQRELDRISKIVEKINSLEETTKILELSEICFAFDETPAYSKAKPVRFSVPWAPTSTTRQHLEKHVGCLVYFILY